MVTGKMLGRLANRSARTCECCCQGKPKRRWKRDERRQWQRDEGIR